MAVSPAVMAALVLAGFITAQERVSFPIQDGGLVYAEAYGKGDRGVVLAHGGGLLFYRLRDETHGSASRKSTQSVARCTSASDFAPTTNRHVADGLDKA